MAYKQRFTDNVSMHLPHYANSPEISRTKKRPVVGCPGCYWYLEFEKQNAASGNLTIYVSRCKGLLSGNFKITNSGKVLKNMFVDFTSADKHSIAICPGHTVTCEAVFSFESPHVGGGWFMHPYELMDDSSRWNSELVVGDERVKVHRGFLMSISPVFEAMFAANTKETETGKVEITDMDATTVKNAIDFCLGRDVQEKTLEEFLGMHQFVDKYAILPAITRIEKCIAFKTTVDNLSRVIDYAWKNVHKTLQTLCGRIYNENLERVVFHDSIIALPNDVRIAVMDAARLAIKEIKKDDA